MPTTAPQAQLSQATTVVDAQQALFLYLFANNGSRQQQNAKAYYLGMGNWINAAETPVSAELLSRFAGHQPPVKPATQCSTSVEGGVLDVATGDRGTLFIIKSLDVQLSTGRAAVGYYEYGHEPIFWDVTLTQQPEQGWSVTTNQPN